MVTIIKKLWMGDEKLWKIFWLWGALIYLTAIPIGFMAFGFHNICANMFTRILSIIVALLGQIFAFIYPIIFCVALYRSSKKENKLSYILVRRVFIPIYIPIHLIIGSFSCLGGLLLVSNAIMDTMVISSKPCIGYFLND